MKLIKTIAVVVGIMNLAMLGICAEITNADSSPVIIEINGGFGHLTSLELKADGTFTWHGWEPGRKVASIRKGKLSAEELQSVVQLANRIRERIAGNEFTGGAHSYTLVLQKSGGHKRAIKISPAAQDQRPAELKALLDSLWDTRNRQEKRSESSGPANGSLR